MRYGFGFLIALAFVGCMPSFESFVTKQYVVGGQQSVTVGSVMMAWEFGMRDKRHHEFIADGQRKELVYSGVDGRVVLIAYREFYLTSYGAAYARQPFYQDLRYDLSKGDTISFQDARILVHSATQERVTFSVITEPVAVKLSDKSLRGSGNIEAWGKDSTVVFYRDSIGNSVGQKIEK